MSIHNYDLLSILDKDRNTSSKIFKIKDKISGETYVWIIIDSQNLTKRQITNLKEKFNIRKLLEHPNLLDFCELLKEDQSDLYYLVVKYCRHGSLKDLMDLAFRDNSRICEEFLCRIIYQIALVVKTISNTTQLDIKNVFLNEDYNVKLFNFDLNIETVKTKHAKTSSLGIMIFEVCTLTKFKKGIFEKELQNYTNLYSKGFLSLITAMIKDNSDLKKNIDRILCNSTLLLKATNWNKKKLLIKIDNKSSCVQLSENDVYLQIEKLKEKEMGLQQKEIELIERENLLSIKEKKIASMENKLKESLKKIDEEFAKLKSTALKCNCKKISAATEAKNKESLDSTYISCGDSVIMPTSKKLNVNEIIKPIPFTRTLSEKRIKFKGHSPLKDIDFNRRRSMKHSKHQKETKIKNSNSEWVTCSDDTDKSSFSYQNSSIRKGKQLFHTHKNNNATIVINDSTKPPQWTKENKKHAFELLRILNSDKENKPLNVKHTCL